ncbi:MAG: PQQ-binding-like beta-propeller repeat protein [Planctomycetes bacterium]|nr:PQQ-binding-like beta-propeller repeat protein [Planctomycetota bacterium]
MRVWMAVACLVSIATGCGGRPRPPGPPVPKAQEISVKPDAVAAESRLIQISQDDWPMWRGPNADGVATGKPVPTKWTETENVTWKSKLPGRGHSSPIILGERIFLETADEQGQTQSVICLDRKDGSLAWDKTLFQGKLETRMHHENSQASSTLACDGERLYATFLNDNKIWLTALELDGSQLWQTEVGSFASKFGYSASPTLYKSLVLLAADHEQGGFVAAVNRDEGSIVWRKTRPDKSSYASPRVVTIDGQDQMVVCGCRLVSSFNPLTGDQLWSVEGTADAGVGLPVTTSNLVIASGGYPQQETIALKADGTVAWRKNVKSYVPSLLIVNQSLFIVSDDGIAHCHDTKTGNELWKHRIGGRFRVSPVASGGNIITTDMSGKTTIFRATPEQFDLVAENQLGTEGFASPGISKGQLFLRVADSSHGPRQEWLYCIGEQD